MGLIIQMNLSERDAKTPCSFCWHPVINHVEGCECGCLKTIEELETEVATLKLNSWKLLHPEETKYLNSQHNAKRRATILGAKGRYDYLQWRDLKKFYGNKCICCERNEKELRLEGLELVPDHVISLAEGGSNSIENIQPLCHSRKRGSTNGCNNRKGKKCFDYRKGLLWKPNKNQQTTS